MFCIKKFLQTALKSFFRYKQLKGVALYLKHVAYPLQKHIILDGQN